MPARVTAHQGDVFEGGADLTALPCGAKPSWKTSLDRWINLYGLPTPKDTPTVWRLGAVSEPIPFPGPKRLAKYFCYGAAVLNDYSDEKTVTEIGQTLGAHTQSHDDIRTVESVLFGTGAGGLPTDVAARSWASGFRKSAHPDARLSICVYAADRHAVVSNAIDSSLIKDLGNAVSMKPGFAGFNIDLKEVWKQFRKRWRK